MPDVSKNECKQLNSIPLLSVIRHLMPFFLFLTSGV